MRVEVAFQDERVDLEVPEERLVGLWNGPSGVRGSEASGLVDAALETPTDYPPLRQSIVPGDRVTIALGADVPEPASVLNPVCRVLRSAGVELPDVTVLTTAKLDAHALPPGVTHRVHDPDDRTQIAYLASTREGRRVYLNRLLTDADLVLPIGPIAFDPAVGYGGPWSALFPGLSDAETVRAFRALATDGPPARDRPRVALGESSEASWLLGCQFQVGVLPGVSGVSRVVAGLFTAVLDRGAELLDDLWSFPAEARAELVIAGVGRPGEVAGIEDLSRGLAAATRLVQRGGKVVLLSRAEGAVGPALHRLIDAGESRGGLPALRGLEAEPDYHAARRIAKAVAWADVYLLSRLDSQTVEDLGLIALGRPEEARRLASVSHSCLVLSQADRTRTGVAGEAD